MSVQSSSFKNSPALKLVHGASEAVVLLHGAHVMSWKPEGHDEQLYSSDAADYSPGSAIRGGIPLCFPQFGMMGELPMHGFVRNQVWEKTGESDAPDSSSVTLALRDSEATRKMWNHPFVTELVLTLGKNCMRVDLKVRNTGSTAFTFRSAFHTYLRVPDVGQAEITGLKGISCHDKAKDEHYADPEDVLRIDRLIERIYSPVEKGVVLRTADYALAIDSENMPDAVVWNPWMERAVQIPDFPDDGYRTMVCIESAVIATPVTLAPGNGWQGSQILTIS